MIVHLHQDDIHKVALDFPLETYESDAMPQESLDHIKGDIYDPTTPNLKDDQQEILYKTQKVKQE